LFSSHTRPFTFLPESSAQVKVKVKQDSKNIRYNCLNMIVVI
jgi:hypothetical protein